MDVFFQLRHLDFVWDGDKAAKNLRDHGVTFENAAEVFLDLVGIYQDASPDWESRSAFIGRTFNRTMLYVVHTGRQEDLIRIISARQANARERRQHEDNERTLTS